MPALPFSLYPLAKARSQLKVSVSYNHSTGILSYGAVINFEVRVFQERNNLALAPAFSNRDTNIRPGKLVT
jgi:hypothetical protein